jgi:hypothetical protein
MEGVCMKGISEFSLLTFCGQGLLIISSVRARLTVGFIYRVHSQKRFVFLSHH